MKDLVAKQIGLRSYDVALGFRNLNENSGILAEFQPTHLAGMAATLAGAIKGHDVIEDARSLKVVAAEVLKISPFAFDDVLLELAETELVRDLEYRGGEVVRFNEQVPLLYDGVHSRLGESLLLKTTSELEQALIVEVDELSRGPVLADEIRSRLGLDSTANERIRAVGEAAELVRFHRTRDGTELAVTPLFAFENPAAIVDIMAASAPEEIAKAFTSIRERPGYAVHMDGTDAIAESMIRVGLVHAPTVIGADRRQRAFIIVPYGLETEFLTTKKQVLEKAMAIVACIRCGEISGGVTRIKFPDLVLARLMDPSRKFTLGGHSSTSRQYAPLIRLGVISAVRDGSLEAARLIPTPDNLDAVRLARKILDRSEDVALRGQESEAGRLLFTGESYLAPIETIKSLRSALPQLDPAEVEAMWPTLAGWGIQ